MINNKEFKEYIIECYPREACGYVVNDIFYPVDNISDNPTDTFEISIGDISKFIDDDYKIIHSHTMMSFTSDPRTPSHQDMKSQQQCDVEFGIVHCDGESVTDILWFGGNDRPPLIGRTYIANVTDCFTLFRDYYKINLDIDFPSHPRPAEWQEWDPNYISNNKALQLFKEVEQYEDIQPGDAILFRIGSGSINHIGVATSNTEFIHHLINRLSDVDDINKWRRQIVKVLRYKKELK